MSVDLPADCHPRALISAIAKVAPAILNPVGGVVYRASMDDLWPTLLGGLLAIAGGFLAQVWASRQRRDEAREERRERWRQEATAAAVLVHDVVGQALPDSVHNSMTADVIRERIERLEAGGRDADRALMALSTGRPSGVADVAGSASALRPLLRRAVRRTILHGRRNLSREEMEDYDRALKAYLEAKEALDRFEAAVRELAD